MDQLKKYNIIYADPPWSYNLSTKGQRWYKNNESIEHYKVMSIEDICNLPIKHMTKEDAFLFLWTTPPTIKDAFKVIESWGFKYKTKAFCWLKTNKISIDSFFWGMGYYTRANTEDCYLAIKGKPERFLADVHQIISTNEPIITPIEKHSKKPDETRKRIIRLCSRLPRIELFAREKTKDWDVWGNEVESDINMNDYLNIKTMLY